MASAAHDEVDVEFTPREISEGRQAKSVCSAATSNTLDAGEEALIADYGPGGRMHDRSERHRGMHRYPASAPSHGSSDLRRSSPRLLLNRYVADEYGRRRRVLYLPYEIAAYLQPRDERAPAVISRLASLLETALGRPGFEALLICKVVTDAYLVNAPRLQKEIAAISVDGADPFDAYLVRALRETWRHAVGQSHWYTEEDEPHSASDLQVTASWFKAWAAADDTSGGGVPTLDAYGLHDVLPGDWLWVLDHLEIVGAPDGLHLEEQIEHEALEEKQMGVAVEEWGIDELKSAIKTVSDDKWFDSGASMLALKLYGPTRLSTFRRVFADVPGAIYGCLKEHPGLGSVPPYFRMYTTGDIFEALGEDVMIRSRAVAGVNRKADDFDASRVPIRSARRQVGSIVELQVTWSCGYTHLLMWLDIVDV